MVFTESISIRAHGDASLDLLLGSQLVGVAALLLAAVHRPWVQPCVAPDESQEMRLE